jgi:hypothetical protein
MAAGTKWPSEGLAKIDAANRARVANDGTTPRPWVARTRATCHGEPHRGYVVYGGGTHFPASSGLREVAHVLPTGNDGEDQANAKLIAAAPSLRDACRELLACLDPDAEWPEGMMECAEFAEAVLASTEAS